MHAYLNFTFLFLGSQARVSSGVFKSCKIKDRMDCHTPPRTRRSVLFGKIDWQVSTSSSIIKPCYPCSRSELAENQSTWQTLQEMTNEMIGLFYPKQIFASPRIALHLIVLTNYTYFKKIYENWICQESSQKWIIDNTLHKIKTLDGRAWIPSRHNFLPFQLCQASSL